MRKFVSREMALPVPAQRVEEAQEQCRPVGTVDKVVELLEGEDGPVALAVGYGIYGLAFVYMAAQIIRVIV